MVRAGIAACLMLAGMMIGCATTTQTVSGGLEKLQGTWENKEYFGSYWTHTFTMYPDGKEVWFDRSAVDTPTGEGRFAIDRKWVDAQGNTWYRLTMNESYLPYNAEVAKANTVYSLMKIDTAGTTMEAEFSKATFPEAFGALGGTHFVYFRRL